MAMILIERWHLAVLRVRLDLSGPEPAVTADLFGYPDGVQQTYAALTLPVAAYGLSGGMEPPGGARVPDQLATTVRRVMHEELGGEAALWLRLVPPYGYLGAVPWERELVPATERPLLRVPDRLPEGADPGAAWSVAIAVNAAPGSTWAGTYVQDLIRSLELAVPASVDVHVFADRDTHAELRARLRGTAHERGLHDPLDALSVSQERTLRRVPQFRRPGRSAAPPPGSPLVWADWIAAGLGPRAVRALHLVADASFDGSRPLLAVSADPGSPHGPYGCAYAGADDIRLLADTLGASVLSFGSPPGNPYDAATRILADGIGLQRAGPTFCSDVAADPDGAALAEAHAFAAGPRGTRQIPTTPSLFAYLQPDRVAGSLHDAWPDPEQPGRSWLGGRAAVAASETGRDLLPGTLEAVAGQEVAARYESAAEVPGWVAASERYLEAKAAEVLETAAVPGETPGMKQAYDRGTAQALAELREFVDRRTGEA
ncbi:hypothetical protein [Streptomyces sp. NRRL S-87]|uniref:hypothetical protein n=1 Tax=Streptomyces sp. NRRL S-87 TaxID=1463920 RepID=UPI0004C0B488|nr:hypothetical protein [Streptomyces sp. NRRL S-87]